MHKAQRIDEIDSAEKAIQDAFQAAAQDIANAQQAAAGQQAGPQPGANDQQQNGGAEDVEFEEVK